MSKTAKIIIAIVAVFVIGGVIWANIARKWQSRTQVEVRKIEERELRAIVSASGKLRAKISVDVSANANGKIVQLAVDEGDVVKKGDLLLRIDPTPAEANKRQIEAQIASARAALNLSKANLEQANTELTRQEKLFKRDLTSEKTVQDARTAQKIQGLDVETKKQDISRLQALLRSAQHELDKVSVHSDIDGIVVQRNIEEGENVFVGAFNNPATILVTIADLGVIEAVIEVDETDIVDVSLGQEVAVNVDAYPDTSFRATVTKVGHSPIQNIATAAQQQATSFEVIAQLEDVIPNVRPGLSCKADITTGFREKAAAVPIQALTLRKPSEVKPEKDDADTKSTNGGSRDKEKDVQGVFVVEENIAQFRKVKTGIAGDRFFEVTSGLKAGDLVVTGPFRTLRRLKNKEEVKYTETDKN